MFQLAIIAPTQAMRAGLRVLLGEQSVAEIVAEASSLADLEMRGMAVDVLVIVAEEAEEAGWLPDIQAFLKEQDAPPALLLIASQRVSILALDELRRQGLLRAWGVLPEDASGDEMLAAVRALNEGLLAGSPRLMLELFDQGRVQPDPLASRRLIEPEMQAGSSPDFLFEPLTPREVDVLQLLAQGLANKQIAVALGISEHTVKFHVASIYSKLGATNRTEAVRLGVRYGLITF